MRQMLRPLAALALAATLAAPAIAYRQGINCGGKKNRTMGDGAVYSKDREYNTGDGFGHFGGEAVRPDLIASLSPLGGIVPGVQERNILSSRQVGWQEYRFDLPNGRYLLSLHFMEWSVHWSGIRAADILVEGEPLLPGFDIFALADRLYGLNLRRIVEVQDGQLNIEAVALAGEPLLSAVHVETIVDDGAAPPVPHDLAVVPGYRATVLTWSTTYERDQLGVAILRSTDGGEEELITPDPVVATRYIDRDLLPGHDYSYRLLAVDASGNMSAPSGAAAGVPLATEESDLTVMGFEMSQENLIWLNTHRQRNDYLPAEFWTLEQSWPDAGLRYRGNTTRSNVKKNYKIKLSSPLFEEQDRINLAGHWFDQSMLREWLSYEVMRSTPMATGRTDWIHLERNGEYIGVYQSAEQVNDLFLETRGLQGAIWKAIDGSFVRHNNVAAYYSEYELKVGSYGDFEYLAALIDVVALADDETFRTEIKKHLDVERFFDFYAGNAVFSGWDITGWNFYLFHNAETGLFEFIPWDMDAAWEMENVGLPIDSSTRAHPNLLLWWNRLYDRMSTVPEYRRMLGVRVQQLIEGPCRPDILTQWARDNWAFIRPDVERDNYKLGWEDMGPFDDGEATIENFIAQRNANLYSQLRTFAPDPLVNLFVNEVVPDNRSGAVDEMGEHEPWAEIHNFGNETIALGGLWLSDGESSWAFPAGSALPAGGHLVVWLDGESGEGPLHSDFRLPADAARVVLAAADGTPIDELRLPPAMQLGPDLAAARELDGAERVQAAAHATFAAANDPTPLVTVSLDAASEVLAGETLELRVAVSNQREFAREVRLALRVESPAGNLDLGSMTISLAPLESVSGVVPIAVPAGLEPLHARLAATLSDEWQGELTSAEQMVAVRDPEPPQLVVNEIMASNDTTYADNDGDFDDWVELYNAGTRPLHLEGLYLSDDAADPRRWPLPEAVLQPGERVLVWCDKDPEQGWWHAPFKLSKSGEEIGVFDLDLRGNGAIDLVSFGAQTTDVSEGRSPDGGDNWQVLPYPTPDAPNP
jgi:hypothetical protein